MKSLCLKRKVREKYLAGEHSRKKLGKEFGVSSVTIDKYVKGLPNLCRQFISDRMKEEIVCYYFSNNVSHRECGRIFNCDRTVITRAIKRYKEGFISKII